MVDNRTGIGVALLIAGVVAAFLYQGAAAEETTGDDGPPGDNGPPPGGEFIPVVFGDPVFQVDAIK